MNQKQIKAIFKQTLLDSKFSRKEKKILNQVFTELKPGQQEIQVYRDIAFDLAREQAGSSEDVIEWLNRVMKILLQYSQGEDGISKNKYHDEVYFSPGQHCPKRIISLLDHAESSVDICVFTITDDRISFAIIDAHKRNISVRVINDNNKSEDLGSDADRLIDAGIPVRFDHSRHHMHHKFALFDKKILLTGSYNWTRSAAESNEENFLISHDKHFLKKYSSEFEKLWVKFDETVKK